MTEVEALRAQLKAAERATWDKAIAALRDGDQYHAWRNQLPEYPDTPDCCLHCHLIAANGLHKSELVAAFERDQEYHAAQTHAAQEAHRRRTGET